MLRGSVTELLQCSYQRSDAAARPLAPSWYLRQVTAPRGDAGNTVIDIPKGVLGKQGVPPFDDPRWLLPEELAVRRALDGADPARLVRIGGASEESFHLSAAAIRALEDGTGAAGPFDGITGPLEDVWNGFLEKAVSATTLEAYGRCPFQYFARDVLKLERLERPETAAPVQALEWGQLCHEILERFYRDRGRAWGDGWSEWLDRAAAEVLSTFEKRYATGYPAAWEVAREELVDVLREAVRRDLDEMRESGFRPVAFESYLTTRLGVEWPEDLRDLPVHGRLDRVDHHDGSARYRIVDYKYKTGKGPSNREDKPRDAAVRGQKLQLPVYVLLAAEYADTHGLTANSTVDAAWYHFLARRWEKGPLIRSSFPAAAWDGASGRQIRKVVSGFLRGIRTGQFYVRPDTHCRFCNVSEICRKDHLPSATRAERHRARAESTRKPAAQGRAGS